MEEIERLLIPIWSISWDDAKNVLVIALCVLLLNILRNRGDVKVALGKVQAQSLRINCSVYLLNAVVTAVPVSLILIWSVHVHWRLISPERFESWPSWVLIVVALFFMDLVGYFIHRFQHSRFFWPFHELHHSDEQMSWFTSYRFHPINKLLGIPALAGTLVFLGLPLSVIASAGAILTYYTFLIHADLPWTFGRAGKLIVSPAMHRWHHANAEVSRDKNFAGMFSCIDVVFGTYYCPGVCDSETGVSGAATSSLIRALIKPAAAIFRRSRSGA